MASLPLPMCRRLAVVDDDGDGVTGDSFDGAMDGGDDDDYYYDGVIDDYDDGNDNDVDGDGAMDDKDDDNGNDCDGRQC